MQRRHFRNFKFPQIFPTAIVSAVLVLSACGGGGGSTTAGANNGQNPTSTPQISIQQTFANRAVGDAENVSSAANSTPRRGSVTQSSNSVNGATVNSLSITVTRGTAGTPSFSIQESVSGGAPSVFLASGPGVAVQADSADRTGFQPVVASSSSNNRNVWTLIFTNISRITDANQWLAGGLYIETTGTNREFGAYFNGGQPFTNNIASLEGTATYDGNAVGIGRRSDIQSDSGFVALAGDVQLVANFGDTTALGSISGTISSIQLDPDGDDPEDLPGTLNLGTAGLSSGDAGFFTGDTSYQAGNWSGSGKWGGQFYNNAAYPGSVGGTFGISFTNSEDDEARGTLIGVFEAGRGQ